MWIRRWRERADERGQGLMEYAMIMAFIAILCVGALSNLGQQIISALYGPVTAMFG